MGKKENFIDSVALVSLATIFVGVATLTILGVIALAKAVF